MFQKLTQNYWPGTIWAIIILLLTGLPGSYFPRVVSFWEWLTPDKIVHIGIFAVFTFLILWGYRTQYYESNKRLLFSATVLVIGVLFGALTEIFQATVFIGRHGSFYDFLADSIGSLIGILFFTGFCRKKTTKGSP